MSDINIIISIDEDGSLRALATDIEEKLSQSGKKAGKKGGTLYAKAFRGATGLISGALGAAATAATGAFVVAGAAGAAAVAKGIKQSGNVQDIETQFRTLLGSGQRAFELVQDLQEFAATTPFELQGLSTAASQLLSFETAQKDIIPTLQQLGDVAAGSGARIDELVIPFGRLVSTQKLTLIELDKFADRGAITYAELARKAGISIRDIRDEISKGRVPFETFTEVLRDSTSEGGRFFGAIEARSRTLNGAISNLGDSFSIFLGNLGRIFRPVVTKGVLLLSQAFDTLAKSLEGINIFDDIAIPITRFADTVIESAVRPLEILLNVARAVGRGIADFFEPITSGIAAQINSFVETAQKVASALGKAFDVAKISVMEFFDEANQEGGNIFEGVLDDTTFSDKLKQQNSELRASLQEQRNIIAEEQAALLEGGTTNTTEKVQMLKDEYTSIFSVLGSVADSALTGVGDNFKDINKNIQQSNKIVGDFSKKSGQALQKGFAGAAGSAFAEFGRALQSGDNALQAFGQAFLKAIGNTLIQQGTAFILEGTAYTFSANPELSAKGPGLIAAGGAMAAFGGLLGASVGGGGGGASSGGGGGTAGTPEFQDPVTGEFVGQLEGGAEPNTVLNINVEGNVVDQDAFTRRLVTQIGEEGGKQGLVFDNFATV